MRKLSARFILIGQDHYRRGYARHLLKSVSKDQTIYIMDEIHEGVCDTHLGARTMATKMLQAEYYWSTVQSDIIEHVKKCLKCQEYDNISQIKFENLHDILSPWSFVIWDMNITGPFNP